LKILGKMVRTVFSKVMHFLIAAIGALMVMSGLQHYFSTAR
jgi:small neutral amino acid transporter SnatA (MarC family)